MYVVHLESILIGPSSRALLDTEGRRLSISLANRPLHLPRRAQKGRRQIITTTVDGNGQPTLRLKAVRLTIGSQGHVSTSESNTQQLGAHGREKQQTGLQPDRWFFRRRR